MKSKILLFALLITSMSCRAQMGLTDTEENGSRTIHAPFIIDGDRRYSGSWGFSVIGEKAKYDKTIDWYLALVITGTNSTVYPDHPGVLIRFTDGKVIELRTTLVNDLDNPSKLPTGLLMLKPTEAQLKMFEAGISKIRVELKNDYVERSSLPDVGETIYVEYSEIKKQFGKPRKTYADGF